jgi:hypothetical protein
MSALFYGIIKSQFLLFFAGQLLHQPLKIDGELFMP